MKARWGILAFLGAAAFLVLQARPAIGGGRWYTYEDCRLIRNMANDGDSFHVMTKSGERIFRLYFVDAPEGSLQVPERVKEQAKYWGVTEPQVLALAQEAWSFTSNFLARGFTVLSRREVARGRSELERFYAVVQAGGESLDDALVRNGLARVYGQSADLPDGTVGRRRFAALRAGERKAREEGKGAWRYAGKARR